jgi:hypothetical protein
MKHVFTGFISFTVVFSLTVFAQTKVDQGKPGTQGPWPVTMPTTYPSDGGFPSGATGAPYPCGPTSINGVTQMDGGSITIGTLSRRLYIVICNSKENSSGNIKCRGDNTAASLTAGTPGTWLAVGDCIPFANPAGFTARCIGGNANYASWYECGPSP